MSSINYTSFFLALFILINGCSRQDEFPLKKTYPVIATNEPININDTGVTLSAKWVSPGSAKIEDFGFIWKANGDTYQISLSDNPIEENFEFRISSDLEKDVAYVYQAYAKIENLLVLGNEVTFVSSGGKLPEISDFNPKQGFDGTLVTLTGHYFSYDSTRNKIFVQGQEAEIVRFNGDFIEFKIPTMEYYGPADISVQVGTQKVTTSTGFNIYGPKIESASIEEGHSGDYAVIEGEYFTQNGELTEVFFGEYKAEIVEVSDTEVKTIVPVPANSLFTDLVVKVRLINGLKTTELPSTITIKKSWENKMPTPFSWSWSYNAFTYIEKGYILETNSKLLYQYDPNTDQWSSGSFCPSNRAESSLFIQTGNTVLKIGGYNNLGPVNDCWEYNFESRVWIKKPDIPFGFFKATYFKLHGKFYIITDQGEVWMYHPANDNFTRKNDFPVSFGYGLGFSFVSHEIAYAVTYGKTWMYREQNDNWIEKSSNPFLESMQSIGFCKNEIAYILASGQALYKYDMINDVWLLASYFPGCRADNSYKTTFTIGNKTYVAATTGNYQGCSPLMYSYQD